MALTARGQVRLLISLAEIGEPVPLNLLRAMHPDLDGEDIGRAILRLAMTGRAELSRHGGVLHAAISLGGNVLLFPVAACLNCGMQPPPPDQTCNGRDHYVGRTVGCRGCGRLVLACYRRPCDAMKDPAARGFELTSRTAPATASTRMSARSRLAQPS